MDGVITIIQFRIKAIMAIAIEMPEMKLATKD